MAAAPENRPRSRPRHLLRPLFPRADTRFADASSITIQSPTAEFTVAPDGYVAAKLLSNQQKLSLDDPGTDPGAMAVVAGKKVKDFVFDLANAQTVSLKESSAARPARRSPGKESKRGIGGGSGRRSA